MALARLVTRTPEFAQNLARSLETAGYSVEFASPDIVSHGTLVGMPLPPADLEVNLDDPSAASSYLMTVDGKEIPFTYDVGEREFILAPAWRKLKLAFAPLLESFRQVAEHRRETVAEATAPVVAPPAFAAPAFADRREGDDPVAESTPMARSLYLPEPAFFAVEAEPEVEPVEFSGAEYFDGQGARKLTSREPAMPAPAEPMPSESAEATAARTPAAPEATSTRTPWLVTAALRAEALRSSLAAKFDQRRNALAASASRLRGHDAAWLRAVPAAAVIALTFLLGWASSNSQRAEPSRITTSPAEVGATENLQQAAVTPLAAASVASITARPATSAKVSPAKRPVSRHAADRYDEGDDVDIAPDVVIRHYPIRKNRGTEQASSQKPAVKRFSDIE